MGSPAICQRWCPGTTEMLLLPRPLEMDPHGFLFLTSVTNSPTTPLQMTSGRSTSSTTIPRVVTSIGKRTLGVRLASDGSFTQEFAHSQEHAITWVRNNTHALLTRDKVYTAYCSMWRPSFEFPLPITCFSKQQCCILQKIFTGPFLSKMGISSKTSRKLIFASYHYSGFAFADTWVQQGLQHLQLLIGHLCHQYQVGNLLQINRDTLQLLLGHPFPPPPILPFSGYSTNRTTIMAYHHMGVPE